MERPCCKYLAFAAKISPKCIIVAFCLHSHEPKPAFACNTVLFFPLLLAFSTCPLICGGMSRFHLRSSFHNKPEFAASSQALNLWFMCSCSQSTPYCKKEAKSPAGLCSFLFLAIGCARCAVRGGILFCSDTILRGPFRCKTWAQKLMSY